MKLATVFLEGKEMAAIVEGQNVYPLAGINKVLGTDFPETTDGIIGDSIPDEFNSVPYKNKVLKDCRNIRIAMEEATFGPPFRHPGKIWGIGLNYTEHARDLDVAPPDEYPVGFNKPASAIIGPEDPILLPGMAGRTTGEAELGIIIGRPARNIIQDEWKQYVAGFVPVIDVTSLDILQLNARYLTLSKSFDTFFSFGPVIYTVDEVEEVPSLQVETWLNGKQMAANTVKHMRFSPAVLVSFLSRVFTLQPGDIISTGTPGAVEITNGDLIEARITGFQALRNSVKHTSHGPFA